MVLREGRSFGAYSIPSINIEKWFFLVRMCNTYPRSYASYRDSEMTASSFLRELLPVNDGEFVS